MSEVMGTIFKFLFALLAVGGVVALGYTATTANKDQQAISQVSTLVLGIQQLYSGQNNYTSLTNTVAITAGLPVNGTFTAPATINDPWGGAVVVAVAAGNASSFTVTVGGVPPASCSKLVTGLNSWTSVSVNATAFAAPVDAGALSAACTAAANTVMFTFASS